MSRWLDQLPDGTYQVEIYDWEGCRHLHNEVCCNDKCDMCCDFPSPEEDRQKIISGAVEENTKSRRIAMNKAVLMGRLTRDIEVRYSQGENPMAVARYTLAVQRKFKREGEPDADFISCVAFGKLAEFAEKYFRQGTKIVITGRMQTGSYTNRDGQKVYTTDIVIEEQEFAESKSVSEANSGRQRNDGYQGERSSGGYQNSRHQQGRDQTYQQQSFTENKDGFMNIPDGVDDELPFH